MLLFSLCLFFTCFYLWLGLLLARKKVSHEKRIKKFLPAEQKNKAEKNPASDSRFFSVSHLAPLLHFLKKKNAGRKWARKLTEAGLSWKPEEFALIRIGCAFAAFCMALFFGQPFWAGILFASASFALPVLYVSKKKKDRLAKGAAQLPQALGTMATAMKAGFSFMQAMQLIGKEIPDPIGTEFSSAVKQMNLGMSMEAAFGDMLKRFPNQDLEMVVTALLIQRSTGGNLAELLETMQETITERIKMKEELNALTSQGRMSAWVISLLPVGLGFLLNMMNPEYFKPLLTHPLGIALLVAGGISGTLGWVIIQKIVNVEV